MRGIDRTMRDRGSVLAVASLAALAGCGGDGGAGADLGAVVTITERGASNPTAAVDPRDGRGYVAWVGLEGGANDVYLVAADAGAESFTAPLRVNDVPGDAAPHEQAPAQVTVGPQGSVYVLWQNNTVVEGRRFPASDLRLAVSDDRGRTFRPAVTVNDDAGGMPSSHTFHDVVVAADGTVYVSWIDSRVRDAVAAASQHAGHAMPGEDALPGSEIRIARSTDGGRTFGPSVVVDGDACPCCRTSVALGADGSVYVAWRKVYDGDVRDIVVARSAPGELAFEAPVRVNHDGWVFPGCPHAGPSLAVDDEGRVHVGWYTGKEERQGLWYAVSEDGARTFGTPSELVAGEWVPPSLVRLAASGDRVWAAWDDRRGESSVLSLATLGADGAPRPLGAEPAPGKAPSLSAAAGRALVAWLDGEAVRTRWLQ